MEGKTACVTCNKPASLRCSRCKINHYCSAACQKADWPLHRHACSPVKANVPPPPPTTSASSGTTSARLPNVSDSINLNDAKSESHETPSKLPPLRKKAPLPQSTSLLFHYEPSADGVDENLVIFFHGLGDKIAPNFISLAKNLKLPQSATCCIQAPTPVPYLEEESWQWYPSFDLLTGEKLGPESPERMRQMRQLVRPELVKFLRHCIDYCGFSADRIVLFGFSQGGSVALDLAAFGNLNLKAVISIAGYFMEESQGIPATTSPLTTRILVLQGDKDVTVPSKIAKDKFKYIERVFSKANATHCIIEGMGDTMPDSEAAWRLIMKFFAEVLEYRNVALESMADVYEVKQ
ncbi:hypothetical protein BGW41_005466 [Actinomortierella wolfii]|nr:hypothetical protein BGW41_005466 [Actinomortierella wolfii]